MKKASAAGEANVLFSLVAGAGFGQDRTIEIRV
jgi:hypothetical protein